MAPCGVYFLILILTTPLVQACGPRLNARSAYAIFRSRTLPKKRDCDTQKRGNLAGSRPRIGSVIIFLASRPCGQRHGCGAWAQLTLRQRNVRSPVVIFKMFWGCFFLCDAALLRDVPVARGLRCTEATSAQPCLCFFLGGGEGLRFVAYCARKKKLHSRKREISCPPFHRPSSLELLF